MLQVRAVFMALCFVLSCIGFACTVPVAEVKVPQLKTHTNSIGMEFVLIPAGSFLRDEIEVVEKNKPMRFKPKVNISKPFYLGKYQVTQEQWQAVMGKNPAYFKGPRNPVETVSWDDVQEFIKRLNAREKHNRYRLPTEMEWELAARGGKSTRYFFGESPASMGEYAWFGDNAGRTTHPVGQKKPNPYGLYDVYGNVWEWVQDWYADKLPDDRELTDYRGPSRGVFRILRGGSWDENAEDCRSGLRVDFEPDDNNYDMGVRLVLSAE
jgi:formylglycine-generating enzyme required for sulfatase activity